jgi:phage shock protein B
VDPTFVVVPAIFLGLPWIIMHYITKWKTAATITTDDEYLLEELYNLAKRLDERMDTVERLVASDNPSSARRASSPIATSTTNRCASSTACSPRRRESASEHPPHHALPRQAERQADGRLRRHRRLHRGQRLLGADGRADAVLHDQRRDHPVLLHRRTRLNKKPKELYVDQDEQKYWQRVRQSPARTAREVRARFRDIDRRLAEVETYYVTSNPRLSAEIERLR